MSLIDYYSAAGGGGGSSIPQTNLQFVASADSANNTYSGSNLVHIADDSTAGAGRFLTISTGTIIKALSQINGLPAFDLSTSGNNFPSQFLIDVASGGMTAFIVCKTTATGSYQNMFDTNPHDNPCSLSAFSEPAGGIQAGGNTAVAADQSGVWQTRVVHFFSQSLHLGTKIRINGSQVGTSANASSTPPQGSTGQAAGKSLTCLFGRQDSSQYPLKGLVAEIGFYGVSLDGSEASLESYLRSKYATW